MHRQSKTSTQVIPKNADWVGNLMTMNFPFTRMPRIYGYNSTGWESGLGTVVPASTFQFNYVRNHPMVWIASCFAGYKGSVNVNFNVSNNNNAISYPTNYVATTRRTDNTRSNYPFAYSTASTNSTSQLMKNLNTQTLQDTQGGAGMALTNQYTQAGLAVNLPYYNSYKFIPFNLVNVNTSSGANGNDFYELSLKRGIVTASTTDANFLIDIFYGSGPDFDLLYFINCPPIFQLTAPSATATG